MKVTLTPLDMVVDMLDIDYSATPYRPATMYKRNGDPGDPAEGGFESVDAVWKTLEDDKGNKIRVNIVDLFDQEEISAIVEEALGEDDSFFDDIND